MAHKTPRYPTPIKMYPPIDDADISRRIKSAAKAEKMSVSEWLYRTASEALLSRTSTRVRRS